VVGFLLFSRRPGDLTGPLLGIAGIFFFAFALSWFRSPYLWTVSALGLGLYRTFAGHMVVAFPDGRVRSTVDRVVVIAVYAWPLTANIVLLTLFDPRDYGWAEWARLQQWAAAGDVVMSANTFDAAGRPVEAEALEPAAVKGREALVSAYRLRPQATLASGP
jgi:hypothetical protein